jgi:cytochrome P450
MSPEPDGTRPIDTIDSIDAALVTELLRLDGPVQAVGRTATCDQIVDVVTIGAGDPVVRPAGRRDDPDAASR